MSFLRSFSHKNRVDEDDDNNEKPSFIDETSHPDEESIISSLATPSVAPTVIGIPGEQTQSARLETLRYVNYNPGRYPGCNLTRVLDAAFECGKPIFAYFCANDHPVLYFHPRMIRIIEEAFVPAIFNVKECNDPDHLRAMRKWFDIPKKEASPIALPEMPSNKHMLRILTHDGKRVVVGSDDVIAEQDMLAALLMHALQELRRHIPDELYKSVVVLKADDTAKKQDPS